MIDLLFFYTFLIIYVCFMFLNPFFYCSSSFSKIFLTTRTGYLVQTPHVLSPLKGFVRNFDFVDKDLINITSKPYLLAMRLSCSDIPFSYGIKSFGASKFWLFFDLLLNDNVRLIVFVINFSG